MRYFLWLLIGVCASCGTHKPQAKPKQSSFQRQAIPAARARALYFNLAYADSLSAKEIKEVRINSIAVPFNLRQQQEAGTIEIFIPEKTEGTPEAETTSAPAPHKLYTQLTEAATYSAVVYLTQGDSLVYPQLSEIKSDELPE